MLAAREALAAVCRTRAMDRRLAGLYSCARRHRAAGATSMPEHDFPGIFVEEVASETHAIAGVPTATTAFLGVTTSGPVEAPRTVGSFAEYEAQFGRLSTDMPLGYAVQHYFLNGGREAVIARVVPSGATLTDADLSSPALEAQQRGLWLLDRAERFNILCIPPLSRSGDVGRATWDAAIAYASRRRAVVVIDPPAAWAAPPTLADVAAVAGRSPNAALYYPRLQATDPLHGNRPASFAPCGAIAGIYARTDAARGVWKAPAGTEAPVLGAQGPSVALSQAQLAELNAMGVNALRALPGGATVLWGARTRADDGADSFKFVPVRRLELFIESSIIGGLQWAAFEPNGPSLWGRLRTSVEHFLLDLFHQGALQGDTPQQAFFVRCDASTMTQHDIDQGIVNLVVGFAPLRPAEFVIIGIGSLAKDAGCARLLSQHYRIRTARYALRVTWDGESIAGVRRVRGLGQLTELMSVRDGGDADASRSTVGPTKFEPVTITRALSRDTAFEKWAQAMRHGTGSAPRKDVRIEMHDNARQITFAWVLKGALPIKFEAPDLNAAATDVAVEELTLAYDGLEFEDPTC
jgi:phage tail-like protein